MSTAIALRSSAAAPSSRPSTRRLRMSSGTRCQAKARVHACTRMQKKTGNPACRTVQLAPSLPRAACAPASAWPLSTSCARGMPAGSVVNGLTGMRSTSATGCTPSSARSNCTLQGFGTFHKRNKWMAKIGNNTHALQCDVQHVKCAPVTVVFNCKYPPLMQVPCDGMPRRHVLPNRQLLGHIHRQRLASTVSCTTPRPPGSHMGSCLLQKGKGQAAWLAQGASQKTPLPSG